MKSTDMKLVSKEKFEIGINKAGAWYWKPVWEGANSNFHTVDNGYKFKYVNVESYFVLTLIQLFFLKWRLYIKIKPKKISGDVPCRYVKIEETHLSLMDIPHRKWSDKD